MIVEALPVDHLDHRTFVSDPEVDVPQLPLGLPSGHAARQGPAAGPGAATGVISGGLIPRGPERLCNGALGSCGREGRGAACGEERKLKLFQGLEPHRGRGVFAKQRTLGRDGFLLDKGVPLSIREKVV